MILFAVACATHQTGVKSLATIYMYRADIPIAPCALVANGCGAVGYSRPVESTKYEIIKFNWGAFPVIASDLFPAGDEWMAVVTDAMVPLGSEARSIVFVKALDMTFDVSRSTMSPGDANETDWSRCTNTHRGW